MLNISYNKCQKKFRCSYGVSFLAFQKIVHGYFRAAQLKHITLYANAVNWARLHMPSARIRVHWKLVHSKIV